MRLVNYSGQEVPYDFPGGVYETEIDISRLTTGLYFLNFFDQGILVKTEKIIKE